MDGNLRKAQRVTPFMSEPIKPVILPVTIWEARDFAVIPRSIMRRESARAARPVNQESDSRLTFGQPKHRSTDRSRKQLRSIDTDSRGFSYRWLLTPQPSVAPA